MNESKTLEILKKAIILERQGQSFYRKVAEQTDNEAVKNIFEIMADEESKHEQALISQAESISRGEGFQKDFNLGTQEEFSSTVLSSRIKGHISAADYEAASIAAAIEMEKKAIELYSSRAEAGTDESEKALFSELSKWEQTHLSFLNEIYSDMLESSWNDAQFWPF
ncbi:MAG: ferritin family protein [Spirochaetaceae bacterium]